MQGEFYVSKPSALMYLFPDKKSEVTDQLLYGTTVFADDESYGGYYFCKTDYGYSGYVEFSVLSPKKSAGTKYVVTSPFCSFYEYPEYRFSPKMTVPRGSIIEGERENCPDEKFVCLTGGNGRCFLPSGSVKSYAELSHFESEDAKRRQILKTAFSYLGTPYLWGGKSTWGIDCSGLCFMAYKLCGLEIYRDAEFDRKYVSEISFDELKPGDLIYYNGHVTIYIGLGEYIHSSATLGGVKISSFDEKAHNFYPKLKNGIVRCARSHCLNHES